MSSEGNLEAVAYAHKKPYGHTYTVTVQILKTGDTFTFS